ncbi:SLATT domain-containing protein [Nocardia brasiliensis]|uniref:SLATT domain-containing protein n=1 Tax=Nocardia brasiliensis TaxID=37326 RepID=UPI0018951D48|nr:SLATT domain-containing protein [Nocardia brasiliensis]MBF6548835.1 SLATT domain-containing protein [Nocardia brasiliensis]
MWGWLRDLGKPPASGIRSPKSPPADADALDISVHHLTFYLAEYERSRLVVKMRARRVVVWTSVANGSIAVLGAAVAVFDATWIGLLSTALAGFIGVLAAWDGLYRHREMWVQRSVILGQLQSLLRGTQLRQALGEDRDTLARYAMLQLNAILEEDLEAWTSLRRTQPASAETDREAREKQKP